MLFREKRSSVSHKGPSRKMKGIERSTGRSQGTNDTALASYAPRDIVRVAGGLNFRLHLTCRGLTTLSEH